MSVRSDFFNSVSGDRKYDASRFANRFEQFFSNGIIGTDTITTELEVSASTGLSVSVAVGQIHINGYIGEIYDSAETLTHDTADLTNNRIDRVIAEMNLTSRDVTFKILKGTAAASPVAPTITQTDSQYQMSLAQVLIPSASSTVGAITDERSNDTVCGVANVKVGVPKPTGEIARVESIAVANTKGIAQNSAVIDEILVSETIDTKIAPTSGKFYEFVGASGVLSQGEIDFTKVYCSSITQGINTATVTSELDSLFSDFEVGQEVTMQNDVNKESLIIQSLADPVITFTTNIANTYTGGANIYRSNLVEETSDWSFGSFTEKVSNPNYDTWDETLTAPSGEWRYSGSVGTDIYARPANAPLRPWKYDTLTDTWDETLTAPSGTWEDIAVIGTDFYTRQTASPYRLWKYDTLTDTWNETLTAPSEETELLVAVGTDLYTIQKASPYAIFKYDTLTDTWDETLANPSGLPYLFTNLIASVGTKIYIRESASPYGLWAYDTLTDAWDETLTAPSASYAYATSINTDFYTRSIASPYRLWKYNTLTDTWNETLTAPSEEIVYITSVGTDIYSRQSASTYKVFKYDAAETITTETDITDVDIRLNISPLTDVSEIGAYMNLSNNINTADGKVSIVDSTASESYTDLIDTQYSIDANDDEVASILTTTVTAEDKITLKYTLNRSLTTDDVRINSILGGVS